LIFEHNYCVKVMTSGFGIGTVSIM